MTKIAYISYNYLMANQFFAEMRDILQEKDMECEFNRGKLWIINKNKSVWLSIIPLNSPMLKDNMFLSFDCICDSSCDNEVLCTNFERYMYVRERADHIKQGIERRNPYVAEITVDRLKELIGVV